MQDIAFPTTTSRPKLEWLTILCGLKLTSVSEGSNVGQFIALCSWTMK